MPTSVFNHRGFTIVELLVVIAIISMLMGLLIPAISAARKTARRASCSSDQGQLAKALISVAARKEYFPARVYGPQLGAMDPTWVVAVLPEIGRNDLLDAIRSGAVDPADY